MVLPRAQLPLSPGGRHGLALLFYVALRHQWNAVRIVHGLFRRVALPAPESPFAARSHSSHSPRSSFKQSSSAASQIQWRATDLLHQRDSDVRRIVADGLGDL